MAALLYEVLITVREDLRQAFESYMIGTHIPDVMATQAFSGSLFQRLDARTYRVSYSADSRERLDDYLAEHSPRLRADVVRHFPDGLQFSREEWIVLASF